VLGSLPSSYGYGRGTATQRFVDEVYQDLLYRDVDKGSLDAWNNALNTGTTWNSFVTSVTNSSEYRSDQVQQLYQQLLHRAADSASLSGWVNSYLPSGGTFEGIAESLVSSAEYFANRGGNTNAGFVNALYLDVLGRAADPAGFSTYVGLLNSGQWTPQTLATTFYTSGEYRSRFVNGLYRQLLDRQASSSEVNNLVNAMAQGWRDETVVALLASSQEFYNKTAL